MNMSQLLATLAALPQSLNVVVDNGQTPMPGVTQLISSDIEAYVEVTASTNSIAVPVSAVVTKINQSIHDNENGDEFLVFIEFGYEYSIVGCYLDTDANTVVLVIVRRQ